MALLCARSGERETAGGWLREAVEREPRLAEEAAREPTLVGLLPPSPADG